MTAMTKSSASTPGIAGRTNYADWDRKASALVENFDEEEREEIAKEKVALGLDGKYARSQSEAEERKKSDKAADLKKRLEKYKERENQVMQTFTGLLGPVEQGKDDESKAAESQVIRITRNIVDAGKRVISIADTSGRSVKDKIVLTQDLSHLESKMAANAMMPAKKYKDDAENDVQEDKSGSNQRSIFGVIKAFISNVHNCTTIVKCKIITGTLEIHNCSNVVIRIESDATVATMQVDLSENITVQFCDAPSGKNAATLPGHKKMYWGEDKDDRIFHAGVKGMRVSLIRDDFVESEVTADYLKDGAVAVGNATPEEFQFVTSVVDGKLFTEKIERAGSTTGQNARAMTEREVKEQTALREKAAKMAIDKAEAMIKIQDKDGNEIKKKKSIETAKEDDQDGGEVEEIYTSMRKDQIDAIVSECEHNKARGNEAFVAGEYAQAVLLYSLVLDKAAELPDASNNSSGGKNLFPRDIIYSNRAACFLKLGEHEKAANDAASAMEISPSNVKACFRRGLALHAAGRYQEALPFLAKAEKLEPKNKQIKQALQFCEVRLTQEHRKRMQ